ncbi:protein-glutamine glutaminase family protein [Saccharopolyspora hattusasensis]|uniref:protein-glutamine glutaminase family protein n=1 Tax=Saccharopolyspora hattusasensis TaxID=1128679 RepID=UPI003D98EA37
MFSSIMVPEGVRRLFQVLTGEDMTDADEGALFAVAEMLESGAAELGEVRALVAELVGKVRTEFSGKAADRFADGLGIFDGLLSSGQAGLLDLAVFVRKTSQQVRYLKLVTIYSLELLAVEMSWAMQFAGATAGASLAWLAARMAVMRFLLTSWWRQLFMRLAMMAAGGVVFNVLPDVQAQLTMRGEESAEKWDRTLTEQAAGMGAFSALVALPMSAVGGLVSNTLTKVLVKGLGDDVDAAILEAAAKKAVAEHAELYPVSAMAKFADAVGKSLDDYAGMSVGAMWLARFGHSVGEALAGSLSELFGEALYAAATGQKVTWNPFSLTAGLFETVFSGVGNLAGLALRGKLHPEGPSPYLESTGGGGDGSDDGGGSGGEKAPLLGAGSGSQTGNIPGSPDKDSTFIPSDTSQSASSDASRSDASDASRSDGWTGSDSGAGSDSSSVSDVDSVFSDTGSVDSAAVSVSSGDGLVVPGSAVVSAVVVGGTDGKDGKDGTDGKRGADGSVPGRDATGGVPVVPGSGQHRPGTPPPAYSSGVPGVDPDRPGTPPPPYSPDPGDDQAVPGKRPLEVPASRTPDSPTVTPHASDVPADPPRPETVRPGSVDESDDRVPADAARPGTVGSGSVVDSGSGVPADAARPETVGSESVVDSDGRVPGAYPGSPGGVTGRDGDPGVDSVARRGGAHRQDGVVVSADSVTLSGEGSPAAPSLDRDPVAVLPAGLPANVVRVPVSAEVVAGGGLAEFVRGADSTGGAVLLVSPSDPNAGVVVTRGEGLALAKEMGRNVVAMMPGQGGREPRFMVFPADGSRPKPLAGPGAAVLTGGGRGVAGLAEASATVPAASGDKTVARGKAPATGTGSAQARSVAGEVQPASTTPDAGAGTVRDTSRIPVGQWTQEELASAIGEAKKLDPSRDEKETAGQIVQDRHDVAELARRDAAVPLENVVALVAAKYHELGREHWAEVVEFSRALADRLGTRRSRPIIHAGAGPARLSDVDSAPVPFGELKPLRGAVDAWGSELRGGEGSLPDVVDGRRVVLGAGDLAGVSEEGRAALEAFQAATEVAAEPRLADVDGHNVMAFLRMLDWWGVAGHVLVVMERKTTWRTPRLLPSDLDGRELVEKRIDAWYLMGENAEGERSEAATRPEDLWDPLTQVSPEVLPVVPEHLNPDRVLPPGTALENIGESVEFFVHVVDPAGVRVEYGLADQGLSLRGREVEWEGLFAALNDEGPAELMSMVNPGVRRDQYLAQALGVDEATARVWRMWSHLPEEWHAEALRRAIIGSVVSTYGGREAVKTLVKDLLPDGPPYDERLQVLGQFMVRLADRRRRLERSGEEGRAQPGAPRSAAEYRAELLKEVDRLGGLDEVVRAGSRPDIRVEVRELGGPPPQRAGELGRQPSPRELNVLRELVHALDGREFDYLRRFFGDDWTIAQTIGVEEEDVNAWEHGRPGDRAVARGILLDTIVAAFGGPEGAVAVEDRLRELTRLRRVRMFAHRQPKEAATAADRFFGLPTTEDRWDWTPGDAVDYVAGDPEVPDKELVRHLGWRRAAAVTAVSQSMAQAWLDGSRQPSPEHLRRMREAARPWNSELVRYLGPGRALEVTDDGWSVEEQYVWEWLAGVSKPPAEQAGKLRRDVLRAIRDGLVPPAWFRRLGWSENWIREAERRLAWADATQGEKFPSDAWEQWKKVNAPVPPLRPESREVIDGLGKSLRASVNYIVVQVLLGNAYARAMVEGSGIVIPDPGSEAATELLEQIADNVRAAKGLLHSGVLRRVVGGAASERFQDATGRVVPQPRLTDGPAAVQEFMEQRAGDDVHFLVLRVPQATSQDAPSATPQGVPRAEYVTGEDADRFLASGAFFEGGPAHYFVDAVRGDGRRIDPASTLEWDVMAAAGDALAWWAQPDRLGPAGAADTVKILGGSAQTAWLDGRLPPAAELLDLPKSERLDRNLTGVVELAELAGRMEQHLETMPPGSGQDGTRALVESAKRIVRQGAWTSTDLRWVKKRLPGMRKAERELARSLRRTAADRELRGLSDEADAGLEELSDEARDKLRDDAYEKLGAPLNGSSRAVSVMAYNMMRGVGDGEIAQVQATLGRIWVDLIAVSAGAGPEPASDRGGGPESVGDAGVVPARRGDVRPESTEGASADAATGDTESEPDAAELQQLRDRLSRLRGDDGVPSASPRSDGGVVSAEGGAVSQDGVAASVPDRPQDEGAAVERTVPSRTVDEFKARWAGYLAANGEFGDQVGLWAAVAVQLWMGERPEGVAGRGPSVDEQERLWDSITRAVGLEIVRRVEFNGLINALRSDFVQPTDTAVERWAERIGKAADRVEQWEASADPASVSTVHGVAAVMLGPMPEAEPGTVDNDVYEAIFLVHNAIRLVLTELLTGVGETREIADGRDIAELMKALYDDFAALLDIPSTDPSWRRSRAKTASWFDPEPVPLRRDQWENLRQAEPDFSVRSELVEVMGHSTPRAIVGIEQLVRYDVRRIKVEGRWVQEYTLKFFLETDSLMGSIDRATFVEKVRAVADRYFNQGYRFPSGEQFQVRVEFPDDPENAHQAISQDSSLQASLLNMDLVGADAQLARILGLYLGILDETPQQRWPGQDVRGVFHRDDMPVSKNQRIAIPRRNRVYGDESVMWWGSSGGRLLPRHLAQLEESTRAYGFRPGSADAGSPTLAAIRPEDFGSVAQWRARTLDTLLSQNDIDVDSVMDALRSVRGKRVAVEGLYRAFQAHTGRELDLVLADVLGGDDAAYAAQLLGMQADSSDTGDPEPPFTSVPPGLGYKPHHRRDVFEYAAAVRGYVSTGLGASDPVVREQSFEAAMRLMGALDRDLRKIWAVQSAYKTQFGSDLRTDLIQLRSDDHEAIGNVMGDVISRPASMEQIIGWHRKLKDTTFENYSLGRTPVRYDHPEDGCYLRVHAWVMDLVRMGASPMKIFVARTDPKLGFYSPYAEKALPGKPAKVEHRYHVAPMVAEHTDSGPRWWVLDWAISANSGDHDARPLTIDEWLRQMGVYAHGETVTRYHGTAEEIKQQYIDDCRTGPSRTYDDGGMFPQGRAIVLLAPAHVWFPHPERSPAFPGDLFEADLRFRDDESRLVEMNRTAERRARRRLEETPGVSAADGSRPRPVGGPGAPVPAGVADSSAAVPASGPQAVAPKATWPRAASAAGGPQSAATTRDGESARLSDVDSAPVPFGELKPLRPPVDGRSELGGGDAEYARGGSRGSLPDVVDGRRVVLYAEDLAGVSEEGRAALEAFRAATRMPAEPRLADVDRHNVLAFARMEDWLGVAGHVLVVMERKTTWRARRGRSSDPEAPVLVEKGIDAWYVKGEYTPGARPDSAKRPEDLWDLLTQGSPGHLGEVPEHLDPDRVLPWGTWLEKIGESVEFFVHVVDPAGVRVEYGLAGPGLWRRGREVEWGGLFAALEDEGRPAVLMDLVNPSVRESRYLAQVLGVDEATARVWRMWSYLPEGHAEALRRVIIGSVVSTYGGREEVKRLVKDLVPPGERYEERLGALGQFMVRLADRRRRLGGWGEEGRDTRSAADYRKELRQAVAYFGDLDQVVRAGSRPDIRVEVRELGGPPPQRAGVSGRQPSRRELNVLRELVHALDGREFDYLKRFFGEDWDVAAAIGVLPEDVRALRLGRGGDRAVVRGILLDAFVAAFGGPERTVALDNRLRKLGLGPLTGLRTASQGELAHLRHVVEYVAGGAVPAGASDQELVRHLGPARAALATTNTEPTVQEWLDGSSQPNELALQRMREAARLPSSELVRYLGPGRAIEVTDAVEVPVEEQYVWEWLAGVREPHAERAGKLRLDVLRAIADGVVPPAPFRQLVWSENWIREVERRLAWADATKGGEFPSDARSQWTAVNDVFRSVRARRAGPVPPLRPESREVIDGLGKSLKASVNYIVVQVLLGNEVAKAMVRGSGIEIPAPGPEAATRLLEQVADSLRAAEGMLHSGVLRRVVGGAASELFQDETGGVVPQLRLTDGPNAVRKFMGPRAGDDVHFLVLRVPPATSQDVPRAAYVTGNGANSFLTSGAFFEGGPANYFVDAVQGDGRRIHPASTLSLGVMAAAGDALAWWAQPGRASAAPSDGDGFAAPASLGEGSQPTAADIILGGPQVAWLDGQLPREVGLLDLPESVWLDRNLAGIAEAAELAGRMEQHLKAMPRGFDPDRKYARTVEIAKRMVRQGAWTSEDLQRVKKRLPAMREVEKKWRDLASRTARTNNA